MNILVLTHSFPDGLNKYRGIFVKEQAMALSEVNNVIVVFFSVDYSVFKPFAPYKYKLKEEKNIKVYEVIICRSLPVLNQFKYLKETYSFIKKVIFSYHKIDLIHSHLAYPAGFLGTFIHRKTKIPHVFTEHTSIRKYYRSFIHKLCVKHALIYSPEIICVSNALRDEMQQEYQREIKVVPNVIDTSKFTIKQEKENTLVNIGFLGSLNNKNKGLDILLNAVAKTGNREMAVHIGGKGSLLEEYKSLSEELGISTICKFYGEITEEKKAGFYSGLDFFVLPSRYETFGIVLVEAMSSGLPVIAAKCGGPQDIVTDETGLLIEKDSIDDLKLALSYMYDNFRKYDREKIRDYAENAFGKAIFISRISQIYSSLI